MTNISKPDNIAAVTVTAPARLHLGFLDLNGGLGRKFGSIGLSLSNVATELLVSKAREVTVTGVAASRVEEWARMILDRHIIDQGVDITVHRAIPEHAGLGSGTQLALAVGTAISRLFNKPTSVRELAKSFHRGARSGIGIGAFSAGGFIIDGGRDETTEVPPVTVRLPFPQAWRILLIFDQDMQGLNGRAERQAFIELPNTPATASGAICRSVLMQLLPALYEKNCDRFGAAVSFIQKTIGDHFAHVQGGRFCSPHMHDILKLMHESGATGSGQSSWGPTGFAFFADETMAFQALRRARSHWAHQRSLRFMLCRGRNTAADIRLYQDLPEINNHQINNQLNHQPPNPSTLLQGKQQ